MSLLLNQPSFCFQKPVLVKSSPLFSNSAFSTSLRQIIYVDPRRPNLRTDGITVIPRAVPKGGWIERMILPEKIVCDDPCRPNLGRYIDARSDGIKVIPLEGKLKKSIGSIEKRFSMQGSSNGISVYLESGVLCLYYDKTRHEREYIRLPPPVTLPFCQTQIFNNVAVSSSSPLEEDCVVAVKFLGPQLSFCRLASNPEWINVRIENPCFFSSGVMFSKKDEMFHIVGSGGHLMGSWDLHEHTSKFRKLQFHNLPEISKTKQELLDSCCTSEHLVESGTTGETFMVKWYKKTTETVKGIERMETKALMVFKLDEEGNAVYTQDIGDLVIFLTKSELYCLPARSFPEGRRNCVKIWDVDETTIVDLAAQKWNC